MLAPGVSFQSQKWVPVSFGFSYSVLPLKQFPFLQTAHTVLLVINHAMNTFKETKEGHLLISPCVCGEQGSCTHHGALWNIHNSWKGPSESISQNCHKILSAPAVMKKFSLVNMIKVRWNLRKPSIAAPARFTLLECSLEKKVGSDR